MAVCSQCKLLNDRGKSVDGAIESARNYVSKGSFENAKQEYHFALMTMKENRAHQECVKDLIAERDRNIED